MKTSACLILVAMVATILIVPAVIGQEQYRRRVAPTTVEQFLREQEPERKPDEDRKKREEEDRKKAEEEAAKKKAAEAEARRQSQPPQPTQPSVFGRILPIIIGFLVLVGVLVGFLMWWRGRQRQQEEEEEQQRQMREAELRAAQERVEQERREAAALGEPGQPQPQQPPPQPPPQEPPAQPPQPPQGEAEPQRGPEQPPQGGPQGPPAGGGAPGGQAGPEGLAAAGAAVIFAILWLLAGSSNLMAADQIVSLSPNSGVQGDKWSRGVRITINCKPTCGDAVSAIVAAKGVAVDHLTPVHGTRNAIWNSMFHIADDAATGPKEVRLTRRDGSVVNSAPVYFYVFNKDVAGGVDYIEQERLRQVQRIVSAGAVDPRFSHFAQMFFQLAYGEEEGNRRYKEFSRKPTHEAVRELIGKLQEANAADLGNLRQELLRKINESIAEFDTIKAGLGEKERELLERVDTRVEQKASGFESRVAALEAKVNGVESSLNTRLDSVERTAVDANERSKAGNRAIEDLGAIVSDLGDAKVKKGGFLGFGGSKPLDPKTRARVAEALRKMRP